MKYKHVLFDMEANGIHPSLIHCMSFEIDGEIKSTVDYNTMRDVLLNTEYLYGHNIMLWDIPHLERILQIKITATVIDTLVLSWYLYPTLKRHGLEAWGEYFGVPKPKIDDWENQTIEDYIHRCEEDTKINVKLLKKQYNNLHSLYDNEIDIDRIIEHLNFKMKCVQLAEAHRWKVDIKLVETGLAELEKSKEDLVKKLTDSMPTIPEYKIIKRPKVYYKKNGDLSARALIWESKCESLNIDNSSEEIRELVAQKIPNPGSHTQVKDWLYSLGWKPMSFKYVRREDGTNRKIPQVKIPMTSKLCQSVLDLKDKCPDIIYLKDLSMISHRISILKGFLRDQKNGYLTASVAGLTNTLRFRHKTLVNLPKVDRPFAQAIRTSLVCHPGKILVGSDMCSLEDKTKQNYIWDYDPEYVKQMQDSTYDPHLDVCIKAGILTEDQVDQHKLYKATKGKEGIDYSSERSKGKTVNYAAVYGAGVEKLSLTLKESKEFASKVHSAYWKINWSVKQIAKDQTVKKIGDQMWLLNPLNNFWYSLRYEKDIFSTLNQGSATYCFDLWLKNIIKARPQINGQFHDEGIWEIDDNEESKAMFKKLLKDSIAKVNNELKLNVDLDIDVQFGYHYGAIH